MQPLHMPSIKINVAAIAVVFLLTAGIVAAQYRSDLQQKSRTELTLLPPEMIKLSDLGLHSAASALLWLYTIQNISSYPKKIPEMIETVISIDPRFSYPYAFSTLILPTMKMEERAIEIAERGLKEADADWRIPYYMATTYHIFMGDRRSAAFYFELAAKTPGAPEKVKNIAAGYGVHKNVRQQTKEIWISIYENSNDDFIRERAMNYITHIEIYELLEEAILEYQKRYGTRPLKLEELVSGKILKGIPESPLGVRLEIIEGKIMSY